MSKIAFVGDNYIVREFALSHPYKIQEAIGY